MTYQTVKPPICKNVYRNIDEEELRDLSASIVDGYLDDAGYVHRRPGLERFVDLGLPDRPLNGAYHWVHKNCVMLVCDGRVFKLQYTYGAAVITDLTGDLLLTNQPAHFDTDDNYCFICNGSKVVYTDGTAAAAYIADTDCPITAKGLAVVDGYLIVVDGTNKFFWCEVNEPLNWSALNFASAAANADPIIAIAVKDREIHLIGSLTTEIWENDGTTPFSRVAGGVQEVGCIAPASVVRNENGVFWLSDKLFFVQATSQSTSAISTPYDKDLRDFSTVSDCIGHSFALNGQTFILWTFPSEGRTLLYSPAPDGAEDQTPRWYEWRHWNVESASYDRWLGNCHLWVPDWGLHLVGSRKNSFLYKLSSEFFTDDGDLIRLEHRSGHIDHGTLKQKRSRELRLRLKRGAESASNVRAVVRWKDDNRKWSQPRLVSLGDQGDRQIVQRLSRLGMYRTRQYEISVTDPVPVVFGEPEEDIEVLG